MDWLLSLTAIFAFAVSIMIFLFVRYWRLRRRKLLVVVGRIVACVFVQLLAILGTTLLIDEPQEAGLFQNMNEVVESNAADVLIIFVMILADVITIIVIALFKSEWVEPLLR